MTLFYNNLVCYLAVTGGGEQRGHDRLDDLFSDPYQGCCILDRRVLHPFDVEKDLHCRLPAVLKIGVAL